MTKRKVPMSKELLAMLAMLSPQSWGKNRLASALARVAPCTDKRAVEVIKMAKRQGYIECGGVPAMWRITDLGRRQ